MGRGRYSMAGFGLGVGFPFHYFLAANLSFLFIFTCFFICCKSLHKVKKYWDILGIKKA
jgi:hypothetical protein